MHTILKDQPSFRFGDYKTAVKTALAEADKQLYEIWKLGKADAFGSGSTVALCLVDFTRGSVVVANVGDSHVLLGEQSLVFGRYSVVCGSLVC